MTPKTLFCTEGKKSKNHCGKWPEPKIVLIMDNVGFHYSDKVWQMCKDAGVKSDFLEPYNPIEEFFGHVKAYAKSQQKKQWGLIQRDFETYLKAYVKAVGSRQGSAKVISATMGFA